MNEGGESESITFPRPRRALRDSLCFTQRPYDISARRPTRTRSVLLQYRKSDPAEHEDGCDGEPNRKELTEE